MSVHVGGDENGALAADVGSLCDDDDDDDDGDDDDSHDGGVDYEC